MKPAKNKEISSLTLVLMVVALGIAAYVWIYHETIALSSEIIAKRESIAVASAKDTELSSIQQNIKATLGDYDKVRNIFVAREKVVDFIQDLESFGNSLGLDVKINGVSNSELEPEIADKEKLTISFFAYGTRSKTLDYLELLENLPYKTTLQDISISKDGIVGEPDRGWKLSGDIVVIKFK